MNLTTKFTDFALKVFSEDQNFSPIPLKDSPYLENFDLALKGRRSILGPYYWLFFKNLPSQVDKQSAKEMNLVRDKILNNIRHVKIVWNAYTFIYASNSPVNPDILNKLANFNSISATRLISPTKSIAEINFFFDLSSSTFLKPENYRLYVEKTIIDKVSDLLEENLIKPFLQSIK
ncbi:MAG: hypothetical protein ACFFDI_13135 [Promethearchaeota archaeon]